MNRVQEFVRMPARGEGSRLRLTVADYANHEQIRIVEGSAEGMRKGVTELSPFVNATGGLGCHVAGDAAGKGELPEQEP
jgi:hypothetical protein